MAHGTSNLSGFESEGVRRFWKYGHPAPRCRVVAPVEDGGRFYFFYYFVVQLGDKVTRGCWHETLMLA